MIRVTRDGSTMVVVVDGELDGATGQELLVQARAAVADEAIDRLDVDLREVDSHSAGGADALVACRLLGTRLTDGLHYRTGRGAGRAALLEAYRAADTGEMRAIGIGDDHQR